jgi:hypothetical protein
MKELIKIFKKSKEINPELGDYIILCCVVKSKKYDSLTIKKAFKKLVLDCPEYGRNEKEEYIDYLIKQTNLI